MHSWNLHNKNSWSLSLHGSARSVTRAISPDGSRKAGKDQKLLNDTLENVSIYEFVVPNTSLYKFIGGPEKYSLLPNSLAISDIGNLVLFNKNAMMITTYFSFTDETRLGFHSIAPIFTPCIASGTTNKASVYTGSTGAGDASMATPITAIPNSGMYYTKTT
jgi:hypothetical protein